MNNKYCPIQPPAGSRSSPLGGKKGPSNSKKSVAPRQRRKTESDSYSSSPSPPFARQQQQNGPRGGSPVGSPFYAGAKFSEPPSPAQLPTPPTHWMDNSSNNCHRQVYKEDKYTEITNQLKLMLNIRA